MIDIRDRSQRPPARVRPHQRLPAAVQRELAKLRGKNLGACAACGQPVFVEQNFSRFEGRVSHVRCPITAHRSRTPIVIGAAMARLPVSRDR